MHADRWLERWLLLVAERVETQPILELGCGSGIDTSTLEAAGHRVVAVDLSEDSIAKARVRAPPAGVLLCRLNSTNDHHFGASGHPEIEPNYYLVDGQQKRFFSKAAVQELFATGWCVLHLEERVVHRYAIPKAVWEVVLEKAG